MQWIIVFLVVVGLLVHYGLAKVVLVVVLIGAAAFVGSAAVVGFLKSESVKGVKKPPPLPPCTHVQLKNIFTVETPKAVESADAAALIKLAQECDRAVSEGKEKDESKDE